MFLIFLSILSMIPFSLESHAGLKFRVTSYGLNYASSTLVDLLRHRLSEKSLTNAQGNEGDFKYQITNIKVESIPPASSHVELRPNVLKLTLSNVDLTLSADWSYSFRKNKWIQISDHGSMRIVGRGLSIAVEVSFEFEPTNNIPRLKRQSCEADMNDLEFEAFGKASILYNTVFGLAREPLKGILRDEICEAADRAIDKNLNKELERLSMQVPVDSGLFLDYHLIEVPSIETDWIEFGHAGTVFGGPVARGIHANDQPPFCEMANSKMVQATLTEDSINSYLKALYLSNKLRILITRNSLPESERTMLDTNCIGLTCVAKWVTKTAKLIKNASLEVDFQIAAIPVGIITKENISSNALSRVDVLLRHSNDTLQKLYSIHLNTLISATLQMEKGLLKFELDVVDQKLTIEDDKDKPEASTKGIEMAEKMIRKKFLKEINLKGKGGIPIPDVRKFSWLETEIQLKDRAFCVSTNLRYEV